MVINKNLVSQFASEEKRSGYLRLKISSSGNNTTELNQNFFKQ